MLTYCSLTKGCPPPSVAVLLLWMIFYSDADCLNGLILSCQCVLVLPPLLMEYWVSCSVIIAQTQAFCFRLFFTALEKNLNRKPVLKARVTSWQVYCHKLIHNQWPAALLLWCHDYVIECDYYNCQVFYVYWYLLISTIRCVYILMKCNTVTGPLYYTVGSTRSSDSSVVHWPSSESGTELLNNHVILMWTLHSMLTNQIAQCLCISVCTHSSCWTYVD